MSRRHKSSVLDIKEDFDRLFGDLSNYVNQVFISFLLNPLIVLIRQELQEVEVEQKVEIDLERQVEQEANRWEDHL